MYDICNARFSGDNYGGQVLDIRPYYEKSDMKPLHCGKIKISRNEFERLIFKANDFLQERFFAFKIGLLKRISEIIIVKIEALEGENVDFEERYSEADIFALIRQLDKDTRAKPTYTAISRAFPHMSKRQIGKIRAQILREIELCKN